MMLEHVKSRINMAIWGTDTATCAECGVAVAPGRAIWHGRDRYCCVLHDERDHELVA